MGKSYKRVSVIPKELRSKVKTVYPLSAEAMEKIERNTWQRIRENEARRNAGAQIAGKYICR